MQKLRIAQRSERYTGTHTLIVSPTGQRTHKWQGQDRHWLSLTQGPSPRLTYRLFDVASLTGTQTRQENS